ncbi:hypothetical protein Dthio_PD0061 [Desulfonatronospira thiodismutans ASO3-1]|uniref:Uncharacterized protein n=1 Tax=Desulfonatronospira thiodismutans ASO3-1 TaxID=555779 RepID=D6SV13_9BACT|nr:hypothetical protein [Desulfonatronospira thiodismutans]EFI32769.1 hypothetical protein Dthio_PD0061 [Desulfonatronospira thiodismutans ASO3-1]
MQHTKLEKLCRAVVNIWDMQNSYHDKDKFIIDLAFPMQKLIMHLKKEGKRDQDAFIYAYSKNDKTAMIGEGLNIDMVNMFLIMLDQDPQIKKDVIEYIMVNDLQEIIGLSSN